MKVVTLPVSLNRCNIPILIVLILTSSCSNHIEGSYSAKGIVTKSNEQFAFEKHLQLDKDSTFSYMEWYKPQDAMMPDGVLEMVPAVKFIGKGHYTVERQSLVLNFSPKIRRVDTIEVSSLTENEVESWWYQVGRQGDIPANKANIFIKMNIDGYYFGNPTNMGYLKINGENISLRPVIYKEYEKTEFPIKITICFDLLSGKNETQTSGHLFPGNDKTLGYNLGYQDEVINIQEAGNYKIEIHPAPGINIIDSQVLTGQRSFTIKFINSVTQVGEMIKMKST